MNRNLIRLAEQRERLVARAEAQRRTLEEDVEPWRGPLALADQGVAVLRHIRSHPEWLVGAVVLLAALRPRRFGKWLGRGWMSWKLLRALGIRRQAPGGDR
jgi:hypothetical protein